MSIHLISEKENISIGLPQGNIEGQYVHTRTYQAEGTNLIVDGPIDAIVSYDAEWIVTHLSGFRVATAQEQDAYLKTQQASTKGKVTETTPPSK